MRTCPCRTGRSYFVGAAPAAAAARTARLGIVSASADLGKNCWAVGSAQRKSSWLGSSQETTWSTSAHSNHSLSSLRF